MIKWNCTIFYMYALYSVSFLENKKRLFGFIKEEKSNWKEKVIEEKNI